MQEDFHYYATYCASFLAGYSHEDSLTIATSAQFVDDCSAMFLKSIKAPVSAATTQLQSELMDLKLDPLTLQNVTRIWASFHFLPYDLYAKLPKKRNKAYMDKYRLICKPNGALLADTISHSKDKGLQAVGIAMHVLADTWAHSYFAGIPSLVINNTNFQFYELVSGKERPIAFIHNPVSEDDIEKGKYSASLYQGTELSVMNLGHGRAGHFPDYSFAHYKYVPAWGNYEMIEKDNPKEYYKAFSQMVYAMRYLRGDIDTFETDSYADEIINPYKDEIMSILAKRQLIASDDWKKFSEKLSGSKLDDFSIDAYKSEYINADKKEKDSTFIGGFILAALSQKSMVTNRIFMSKNLLAGFSVDYNKKGLKGIKDYFKLAENMLEDTLHE